MAPPPKIRPPAPTVPPVAVVKNGTPRLAIVLDDMGLDHAAARRAADLPGPVTLAFLPYATDLPAQTANAREKGHELMVHMPMEPTSKANDPGPNALKVGLDAAEIKRRMDTNLGQFSGYVGFNNHMGSRFTTDSAGMRQVLSEARDRGLLFLDSRTTTGTLGVSLAQSMGVPYAKRDVFLDNSRDPAAIRRQLAELEALAQKQGSAIAIGHPYAETLAVLEQWIPEARAAGYEIVPLSALVKGADVAGVKGAGATGDGS
ncbi:divergent polysaccharide deacetylase family protein [Govanella unica]|uniref:Divergent polysaccharide deacetylase family protein n=1 Tax=Govanella unica TaxID=2975056 RepID=A0A9X3TYL8_9PROT|nr:divergent polysaccharide deacetylase family protein [Govania unica]